MNHAPVIAWGKLDPQERGPVCVGRRSDSRRNVIGTWSNGVNRSVAIATGNLSPTFRPDFTDTEPTDFFGPHDSWKDIVSLDPFGDRAQLYYKNFLDKGYGVEPSIGVTRAQLDLPEVKQWLNDRVIKPDGRIVMENGKVAVTKAYIDQVWHLPGVATRLGLDEMELRETLYEYAHGPEELVQKPEMKIYIPPMPGITVYIVGDPQLVGDRDAPHVARVHDACHGSDAWGSDICTCRPFFMQAMLKAIQQAKAGGVGVLVYNHSTEGKGMRDVLKLMIYNARKRHKDGDTPELYLEHPKRIAGAEDMRIYQLTPDPLLWLGVKHIDHLISESQLKYKALLQCGITVGERVSLPDSWIPADAGVEMTAKRSRPDLYQGNGTQGKVIQSNGRVYEQHLRRGVNGR